MKAIIYARCATTTWGKTNSVDSQIKKCLVFAHDNNYEIDETGDIYTDVGVSGSNLNRPGFRSMMGRISKDTRVKIIIVRDISRISRNLGCYVEFKHLLEKSGKKFISASEPHINDDNPASRLMENLMVSFAEFQDKRIKKKRRKPRCN